MNNKMNEYYIYLCLEYKWILIVLSDLIIECINLQNLHIVSINSYHILPKIVLVSGQFIFILIHLVLIKEIKVITLEVNTYNYLALSLYFWLGYQLLLQRPSYYKKKKILRSQSNYTLINNKFVVKNMIRRYLIYLF